MISFLLPASNLPKEKNTGTINTLINSDITVARINIIRLIVSPTNNTATASNMILKISI